MLNLPVILLYAAALGWGGGFILRALTQGNEETRGEGLRAEEILGGFLLLAVLCRLSLALSGRLVWGALGGGLAAAAAFAWCLTRQRWRWKFQRPELSAANGITLAFLLLLLVCFAPLFMEGGIGRGDPDIYDFPKQVSATVAAAQNGPAIPNPYYPRGEFAYNLLFYLPPGFIAQQLGTAAHAAQIFSAALIWTAWLLLRMVVRVMTALGTGARLAGLAVLFASFAGNYKPLYGWGMALLPGVTSAGTGLRALHSAWWGEDPFLYFVNVPQHLLAVAALLGSFVVLRGGPFNPGKALRCALLLGGAALCSLILAPVAIAAAALSGVVLWREARIGNGAVRAGLALLPAALLFTALAAPAVLDALRWSGAADRPQWISPFAFQGWHGLLPWASPFFPLAVIGLCSLSRLQWREGWGLYCATPGAALLLLVFLHYPDSALKLVMLLRFMLIPPACLGAVTAAGWLRRRAGLAGGALAWMLLALMITLPLRPVAELLASSWRRRSPEEADFIRALRHLPTDARILLLAREPRFAADSGHLCYQDFSAFRADRYLPASSRKEADEFFRRLARAPGALEDAALPEDVSYIAEVSEPGRSAPRSPFSTLRFSAGCFVIHARTQGDGAAGTAAPSAPPKIR